MRPSVSGMKLINLFRPTFRTFVLANFKANGVAAQPIIYRRV
ncbi:hypothetical protein GCM10010404_89820 [Nonomuraea africana]